MQGSNYVAGVVSSENWGLGDEARGVLINLLNFRGRRRCNVTFKVSICHLEERDGALEH